MLQIVIGLCVLLLVPSAALAEKRVALVIGNGDYANVSKLPNPNRDMAALEALLRAAGFDIVEAKRDLGVVAMRRALRDFASEVRNSDIALVFYAGHGIEVNGTNYLIPVDAAIERDTDVEDETVSLDRVVQYLEPAKRLRLVILDACRDNPFVRTMKRTVGSRSIGRGLAKVEVLTSDTLIAFAAKAGSTAADGDGTNSPYTSALVKHLTTPGLDLRLAFGRIRDEVLKVTANRQEPFVYGSLGGTEIPLVAALEKTAPPVSITVPPPATQPSMSEASVVWALVKDTKDIGALEAFRSQYGAANLFFDHLAEARIEELKKQQVAVATTPPPTPAMDATVLARALQTELKRVGCDPGPVNGTWSGKAQQALSEFGRMTKAAIPDDRPSESALKSVTEQKGRICPLRCGAGETEAGDRCVAKAAPAPKAKAAPRPNSNSAAKAAPKANGGMCWATTTTRQLVPCSDPNAGKRAY